MTNRTTVSFTVKDKKGKSAGKVLAADVPEFDWESFKNTPNANEFVKRAYYAEVKKIIREIRETRNGTVETDLESFEAIITRSLSFTKQDIRDWMSTRDWNKAAEAKDIRKVVDYITPLLPEVALRKNPFPNEDALKLADKVISAVCDSPIDPVADFINTILTTKHHEQISAADL
jgi:hypothetical protein